MPTVKFFATLREITGKKEILVESATTVGELLEILYEMYGEKFKRELQGRSMILVNGKNIHDLDGTETKIKDDAEISIFPPAGGG